MIAIVDYGVGNLFSLSSSVRSLGAEVRVTRDAADLRAADHILLPGVGAFADAMAKLEATGLVPVLREETQKKPLLGICRGAQVLNVAFGGDLIQNVPDPQHHMAAKETGDAIHTVRAQHDLMREFYGEEFPVNSAHHQAVWRLGTGLQVFACAEDGTVEAVGHRTLPVFAVQWHPERLCGAFARPESADGARLLRALLR